MARSLLIYAGLMTVIMVLIALGTFMGGALFTTPRAQTNSFYDMSRVIRDVVLPSMLILNSMLLLAASYLGYNDLSRAGVSPWRWIAARKVGVAYCFCAYLCVAGMTFLYGSRRLEHILSLLQMAKRPMID